MDRLGVDAPIVFVIRIWFEPSGAGGLQRGYVEHLASRQRRYFSDVAEALEFVRALTTLRHVPQDER